MLLLMISTLGWCHCANNPSFRPTCRSSGMASDQGVSSNFSRSFIEGATAARSRVQYNVQMNFNNTMPLTHAIGQSPRRLFEQSFRDCSAYRQIKANRAQRGRTIPKNMKFITQQPERGSKSSAKFGTCLRSRWQGMSGGPQGMRSKNTASSHLLEDSHECCTSPGRKSSSYAHYWMRRWSKAVAWNHGARL